MAIQNRHFFISFYRCFATSFRQSENYVRKIFPHFSSFFLNFPQFFLPFSSILVFVSTFCLLSLHLALKHTVLVNGLQLERAVGITFFAAVFKSLFAVYFTPLNSKPACSTAFLTSSAEAVPVTTRVFAAGVASQEATPFTLPTDCSHAALQWLQCIPSTV